MGQPTKQRRFKGVNFNSEVTDNALGSQLEAGGRFHYYTTQPSIPPGSVNKYQL